LTADILATGVGEKDELIAVGDAAEEKEGAEGATRRSRVELSALDDSRPTRDFSDQVNSGSDLYFTGSSWILQIAGSDLTFKPIQILGFVAGHRIFGM
jgi:hypothetical protein